MKTVALSSGHRALKALIAGGFLLSLGTVFMVPPADLPLPACAFHSITGHSCLTCGMTRSLHALAHGEFAASVQFHLLGPAVFIAMLLGCLVFTAEAISGKAMAIHLGGSVRRQIIAAFAAVWIIYWGVRLVSELIT
jgi:hypothetical protein